MARKNQAAEIGAITHEEARRSNIPTSEMKPLVADGQKRPVRVAWQKRNPDLDPQLVWRGKFDGDDTLTVKAPPLYIQEKIHPRAMLEDMRAAAAAESQEGRQLNLFGDFNGMPKDADKTDFYRHEQNWTNRMILGDSLQVMASLAEREGLRGQVQAIYMDPPYGIRFNSNFQWSTNSRNVTDGKLESLTREPEQVKAFRDTWEDGIHSYLTYLRDRFIVARDLLTDSGSIFVQIGDENVHHVRELLDEVFGAENFYTQITYISTSGLGGDRLPEASNFILWYCKNISIVKYRAVVYKKEIGGKGASAYKFLNNGINPEGYYALGGITSSNHGQGTGTTGFDSFKFQGHEYKPDKGSFKTNRVGMERLEKASRLALTANNTLRYIRSYNDYPYVSLNNVWTDTITGGFVDDKIYVVQTPNEVIKRCILLATDPGDLVLDPTCGSGTTAYVAEQWGRRWITIDTSRVAMSLARARLMGARYPYYLLEDSAAGAAKEAALTGALPACGPFAEDIRLGFVYERVPHITLKAIANNADIDVIWEKWQPALEELRQRVNSLLGQNWEEWQLPREPEPDWPEKAQAALAAWWQKRLERQAEIDASIAARADYEFLQDRPYEDKKRVRVAGPFTAESISPYRVLGLDADDNLLDPCASGNEGRDFTAMILENLRAAGVQQAQKGNRIVFTDLEPFPAGNLICAEGRYLEGEEEKRAAIFIGPEFGTVSREDIIEAAREAGEEKFDILVACAFNFEANTGELRKLGIMPILKARMNAELHMTAALRKTDRGNLFVVFGEPDIEIVPELDGSGAETGRIMVQINGVDVYNPATGQIVSDNADDIACWLLDTSYNEESFFVRQAYFLGQKSPYEALRRALNAEIDREAWESLRSARSRPFPRPATGRIAVKVINHLGDEVMKVFKV